MLCFYNFVASTRLQQAVKQKGLYLHGGVGTGKTLLLDIFYDAIPTNQKKRVHFNTFMLYLYSELNRWCLCCDDVDENGFVTPTEHIASKIVQVSVQSCSQTSRSSKYIRRAMSRKFLLFKLD